MPITHICYKMYFLPEIISDEEYYAPEIANKDFFLNKVVKHPQWKTSQLAKPPRKYIR